MMNKRAKRELRDRLHRGFVKSMIGLTIFGLIGTSINIYVMIQSANAKEKLMLAELNSQEDGNEFPNTSTSRVPQTVMH